MKMIYNIRDVRGSNFCFGALYGNSQFFGGQWSKGMGWGGVIVNPSWVVAKITRKSTHRCARLTGLTGVTGLTGFTGLT